MTDMQNHTVGPDMKIQHEDLAFMIPTTRDPDNKRSRQQEIPTTRDQTYLIFVEVNSRYTAIKQPEIHQTRKSLITYEYATLTYVNKQWNKSTPGLFVHVLQGTSFTTKSRLGGDKVNHGYLKSRWTGYVKWTSKT